MSEPLVSVVIPAYRNEAFLAEALDSVIAQTYPAVEIVVVDDGSPDRSSEIAAAYPQVRLLRQENAGVCIARNRGVAATTGALIAFLDGDDTWEPQKLERQVAVLRQTGAPLAICHGRYFFEGGEIQPWFRPDLAAHCGPMYQPGSWLMTRTCWDTVGPFDPEFPIGQDVQWLTRAKDQGIVPTVVPEMLFNARVHPGQASRAVGAAKRDIVRSLRDSVARRRAKATDVPS